VGLIAAAATAGVAAAYGRTIRGWLRPFASVGRHLMGSTPRIIPGDFLFIVFGLAFHIALMIAWGVLFALVAARLRSWLLYAAAAVCGVIAFAVDSLLPPLLRPGYDVMALRPQIAVHVALSVALAVGMRLAQPQQQD
jgi:hypothetical protein